MSKPVLVLGSLGNVGTEVVKNLLSRGVAVRAADRNPEKVKKQFGDSVQAAAFDFTKSDTWPATFAGIENMFLLRPPQISDVKKKMYPALDAARAAGVKHVTFLSLIGIEQNTIVPHWKIEEYLRASGQTWSFLRCSFFMQNLNTVQRDEIRDEDAIIVPVGTAKTSFIDVRDIGAVAALTLSSEGHENVAYDLTGPEALDYVEVAALFSNELGRTITYRNPSALSFFFRQIKRGQPVMFAFIQTWLYSNTKGGMADVVTTEVQRLLQRPASTMKHYIADYRSVWIK